MNATERFSPRVVIAESDPWVREMLREIVRSVRCDVHLKVCRDGSEALSALAIEADLVLAGRELPDIDGLDLLREVRTRGDEMPLPFILMSERSDIASVRETLPYNPTAYLSKPLDLAGFRKRLEHLLLEPGEQIQCPALSAQPSVSLSVFLKQRRALADGGALFVDVQTVLQRASMGNGLDLRELEEQLRNDPQISGVLIAAANSAAMYRNAPVQRLPQALNVLGGVHSMNLILGLALNRSAHLSDPLLTQYAQHFLDISLQVAEAARTLARMLNLDQDRCYLAGLLHRLGDLAVLRSLQEWSMAGGELDDELVQLSLQEHAAPYGSALRVRWRVPHQLRQLVAAIYHLGGGVYSQEVLVMNLAAQLAGSVPTENNEQIAGSVAARLLKISLADLDSLREPPTLSAVNEQGQGQLQS
ncbi:HDOD domain-containing protein [Pseudomonas promysalinigenes]